MSIVSGLMKNIPIQGDRAFGLTFAIFFLIIGIIVQFVFNKVLIWIYVVSMVFAIVAFVLPSILMPFNLIWRNLSGCLGKFNNYLLLGVFYTLIMVPFGIILTFFGWDPMCRSDRANKSAWKHVKRQVNEETLKDLF